MIRIRTRDKKKKKYEKFIILEDAVEKAADDYWSKKSNRGPSKKAKAGFWELIWVEMNKILCGSRTMLEFLCEKLEAEKSILTITEKYKKLVDDINYKYKISGKKVTKADRSKISQNILKEKKEKIKLILVRISIAEFSVLQEIQKNVNEEDFYEKGRLKWAWEKVGDCYEEIWQKRYVFVNASDTIQVTEWKEQGIRLNNYYVGKTNINVCPYCNHDFVNNRDTEFGAQLDHFYPKSRYPLFSASLYNLIPVCGTCNRLKGDSFEDVISPYEDFDFQNQLYFSYVPKEYGNLDQLDIVIYTMIDINGRSLRKNIENSKVEYAYQIDNEYVADLIKKALVYSEETLRYLETDFPDLFNSRRETLRFLSESFVEEEEYLRYPRAKLTHDILKEMGFACELTEK